MRNTGASTPDVMTAKEHDSRLKGVLWVLHRVEDALLLTLFFTMLAMAVLQIVLRVGFSTGVVWGDELVRILVLWICLFGAMTATRQDRHINIDVLPRYLPERFRKQLAGVVRIATCLVCLLMTWQGIQLVRLDLQYRTPGFAMVPAWVCELIIPVGFAVMALRYAVLSVHSSSEKKERLS